MSWKKNVFSYLLWVLYAVMAEVGLVCLADAICDLAGVEIYIGTVSSALYIILAGAGVYLVHRAVSGRPEKALEKRSVRIVPEAAAVLFLIAGLVLRAWRAGGVLEEGVYYDLAAMASEEELPRLAHGAAGLYIRLLHGLFYFLGNKPAAAVWMQILLQMGAMLLLYFAVRKLAGRIAAIVMLGFGMLSPYLIREVLRLSPAMLYLLFWSAALLLTVTAAERKKGLWSYPAVGLVIAFAGYLDAAGFLLLFFAGAVIFREEEACGTGRRLKGLLLCLTGAGAGFVCCMLADALMRGGSPGEVLTGWFQMYQPKGFRLPVSVNAPEAMTEYIILFCALTLGMFSFWRERQSDYRKPWVLTLTVLAAAGCFGIFSEEVPIGLYMYLLLTILAGIAVAECVRRVEPEPEAETAAEQTVEKQTESVPVLAPPQTKMEASQQNGEKKVRLIENPLPLPKKHVKKKLDYSVSVSAERDDFDLEVDEKDDFDI